MLHYPFISMAVPQIDGIVRNSFPAQNPCFIIDCARGIIPEIPQLFQSAIKLLEQKKVAMVLE
jgi:hypothetical protein